MKYYKDKSGWEYHIWFKFPRMQFWGILTIIAMISKINELVQIASTLFIITGVFTIWKCKKE